jgi:hypothetical protein
VTSYLYAFTHDTSQLRGIHRLRPGGRATGISQFLPPSELGLAPTANSPGSGSQTSLFSLSCTATWTPLKPGLFQASLLPISSPQLTAAAGNYTYINLRFWAGQTLPWCPADVIIAFLVHVDLSSSSRLGDTGAFGPGF